MHRGGHILRLGTRRSLLAIAQSRLIAAAIERQHANLEVRLAPIDTAGDRDLVTPLDSVADPSFFSDALDQALIGGQIDLAVHSAKDLAESRPAQICRAAIPARENPRDVVLFRRTIVERLQHGEPIRIGSSSARRVRNVENFLREALPATGSPPNLKFLPLRGSVDARVRRIAADAAAPDALDGVVLALAGLARLWRDPDGRAAIEPSLHDARWMVLPPSECPTAPAQGALAIECRADDVTTRELLAFLHDEATAGHVASEFDALRDVTNAQRSAVGATAVEHSTLGTLLYRRGDRETSALGWTAPPAPHATAERVPWDGGELLCLRARTNIEHDPGLGGDGPVFVAHWNAAPDGLGNSPARRVWTSGTTSWRKLAARGIWVEGCADNLGFADIVPTLQCEVLGLPDLGHWTVLTRSGAEPGWRDTGVGRVIATYALGEPDPVALGQVRDRVRDATDFFWGSIDQYRAVADCLPPGARHACGAGKTAGALRQEGVTKPLIFPNRQEWRAWLR